MFFIQIFDFHVHVYNSSQPILICFNKSIWSHLLCDTPRCNPETNFSLSLTAECWTEGVHQNKSIWFYWGNSTNFVKFCLRPKLAQKSSKRAQTARPMVDLGLWHNKPGLNSIFVLLWHASRGVLQRENVHSTNFQKNRWSCCFALLNMIFIVRAQNALNFMMQKSRPLQTQTSWLCKGMKIAKIICSDERIIALSHPEKSQQHK